jgi:hypothetical protein
MLMTERISFNAKTGAEWATSTTHEADQKFAQRQHHGVKNVGSESG